MTVTTSAHPVSRARRAIALCAIATFAAAANVAFAPSPASAAPLHQLRQGETITLGGCPGCTPSGVRVDPPQAGTASLVQPGASGDVSFTAAADYLGTAFVTTTGLGTVFYEVMVVGNAATASGSFTPVAAPGPCIVITSNPVVPFGDVTIGGDFASTPAPPSVAGCAPTTVRQDVLVQTSNATNGAATLNPACAGATPATCIPADGFYAVGIPGDALIVGQTPSLWLNARSGDFPDQVAGLAVRMPPTLAPTFVGSVFTFDITFTAVTD